MKDLSYNLAFRQLRKIVGKSQTEFANLLGCSLHTVISIENDRNGVSNGMKELVLQSTGALLKRKGKVVPDIAVNPYLEVDRTYSRDDYAQWVGRFDEKGAKRRFRESCDWLQVLFEAALRPGFAGLKNRLPGLCESLAQWMDRAREEFSLEDETSAILKERTKKSEEFRRWIKIDEFTNYFTRWAPRSSLNCGPHPDWENIPRTDPLKSLQQRNFLRIMSRRMTPRKQATRKKPAEPSTAGVRPGVGRKPSQ